MKKYYFRSSEPDSEGDYTLYIVEATKLSKAAFIAESHLGNNFDPINITDGDLVLDTYKYKVNLKDCKAQSSEAESRLFKYVDYTPNIE